MLGHAGSAIRHSALLSFFAVLALSGCSSSKPKPVSYSLYSEADTQLNRDAMARPLSVVLNVYQLRDRNAFARLTFEDFVSGKADTSLLGDDLIQKAEVVVLPGEKQALNMKLVPDAQYLGIVAIYRAPSDQEWRYLIPAKQVRDTRFWKLSDEKKISLRLHDCHMSVEGVQVEWIAGQKANLKPVCPVASQVTTTEDGAL